MYYSLTKGLLYDSFVCYGLPTDLDGTWQYTGTIQSSNRDGIIRQTVFKGKTMSDETKLEGAPQKSC